MDFEQLIQECPDVSDLERLLQVERYAWLSLSQDPAMVVSIDGQVEDANTHWERMVGLERERLQGGYLVEYIHFDDREQALAEMQRLVTSDIGSASVHFRFAGGEGEYVLLSWTIIFSPFHNSYFCTAREVRRDDRRRSDNLAYRDVLTGLANRLALTEVLVEQVASCAGHGETFHLLFIDLDGFKAVNDTFGHKAGDALLVRAARRMQSCMAEPGGIFRQGGDEFIVLTSGGQDRNAVKALAERLLWRLSAPYELEGQQARTGASIGIAAFPADGATPEDILDKADQAMYHVKRHGKNGYAFADQLPPRNGD
ncbi:MAG: sensor domain-containing diguanylate cyclase [Thermodesulfobacteriota bacterium]